MKIKLWCTALTTLAVGVLLGSPMPAAAAQAAAANVGSQATPAAVYGKLLKSEESEIVGAAEAMPAEKYNFAPTNGNFQGVRTFASQVKHLAQANYHLFGQIGPKPTADLKAIGNLTTKDEIVKALKDSYAFGQQAIDTITAENAFTVKDAHGTTRAGMATYALVHANDHYGQMVEYLRMNGIIPPASRK
jgi:uncharacterized damage-inducible protein DinB